jgi:hypothetical protein
MSKQTFVANTILTAAQMNTLQTNDYNQTVSTKTASYTLVAADAGTTVVMNAAGATTITVNTSLFAANDTLKLSNIGAGVCTVTAGTATVSSAGPLAIPQYGGGTLYFTSAGVSVYSPTAVTVATASSGLTFISSGTVSAGTTISILNAFSTTYDFYSMRFSNVETSGDNTEFRVRLGSSGSADTGANYNSRGYYADTTISATSSVNATSFLINENMGTTNNGVFLELSSPFLSGATYFSSMAFGNYSGGRVGHGITGMLNTSTSYTDIFFIKNGAGNVGPFTYALFGYAKS